MSLIENNAQTNWTKNDMRKFSQSTRHEIVKVLLQRQAAAMFAQRRTAWRPNQILTTVCLIVASRHINHHSSRCVSDAQVPCSEGAMLIRCVCSLVFTFLKSNIQHVVLKYKHYITVYFC